MSATPSVEEPVAVVVGAASGIGRAAALTLGERGHAVSCLDIDEAGAKATADTIVAAGGTAVGQAVDVADPGSVHEVMADVVRVSDRVDVLVNCAGITGRTNVPTHEVDVDDFDRVVAINLRGAFLLSQCAMRTMLERQYGRILHVASIAGKEGNPGMVAYSASKAGMIGLVKAQAKECATTGVTVNALAPAVIQTPMVDAMPQQQIDYMTERIPMRRCGTLQEVADMIAWIVSPECSFTTGFTFDLSGGRSVY